MFRDWMQDLADRAVADLAGQHFDIPDPIRTIECCIAPTHDGSIYYTDPAEDFSRPGQMWWAVPAEIDTFATWKEVTTVYHEGVPGHHLQIAQNAYRSDLLNRWQRKLCFCSGHSEGWALYAERLMDDLGFLEPGDRMGMLDAQAFRAVRVIIDIGMHLQLRIPPDNPWKFRPGRTLDAGGRLRVHGRQLLDRRADAAVRARPLPRLAGSGARVQGRRAGLAGGPRRRPAAARGRLRPAPVPCRRLESGPAGSGPVARRAGPALTRWWTRDPEPD